MPMKTVGGAGLGVVAGDVLALRGTGLAAAETWALLCQAAQALQDLFLSNGGVVGDSRAGPVVTPHTLELTARGRVTLLQAPPDTARAYLPPEYRPGRVYSDTDSEKMWMYSLGRALLDTTPRMTALTGTVSVSPTSALQSVLAAMTEPDPRRRASLMNLLDVISEYCRTRLQSRPFTHIVMDMYREVVRSTQYAARKRAALQPGRSLPCAPSNAQQQQLQHHPHPLGANAVPARQNPPPASSRGRASKGALFRAQSRNSRSQPNLLSVAAAGPRSSADGASYYVIDARNLHQRTNSQPECCFEAGRGGANVGTTLPQVRSSGNLVALGDARNSSNPCYVDPVYAMPVKPFLSSQDVRNAAAARSYAGGNAATVAGLTVLTPPATSSQPSVAAAALQAPHTPKEELYATSTKKSNPGIVLGLQRQHSSPQFASIRYGPEQKQLWELQQQQQAAAAAVEARQPQGLQQTEQKQNGPERQMPYVPRGPPPPKPPRIITSLKKAAAAQAALDAELKASAKPLSNDLKNGPRARRGRAVQRAPSRLYRAVNGPARSFNKTQCVGPEFVVRANQPAKLLTAGDFKMNNIGRLTVIHLNGQRLEVTCDPQKVTAGELFQAIVQTEGLEENFTLGLAILLAGDFAILPPDTKLNKVAPPGWLNSNKSKGVLVIPTSFILYLRHRFFLPSLRGIRSWISKHLLYLQIRRCILEQQLVCPLAQLINLTGLALQAEFGNYNANEHGCSDYFLLEHYVPESLILNSEEQQYRHPHLPDSGEALRKRLQQAHRERRGLDANKAEEMFITHAQSLPDYGAHYYVATVDAKELGKIVARMKKFADKNQQQEEEQQQRQQEQYVDENIYDIDKCSDYPIYGKIDFNGSDTREQNFQRSAYTDEQKIMLSKSPSSAGDDVYASSPKKCTDGCNNAANGNNNKSASKTSKFKKSDSDVWLAIHSQGLKVLERGPRLRERVELAKFLWKDIQTLSYGKNCLVVYTRIAGKRCKFKLRMDHRKSFYAFKLTSLHHQFFLKLRSELTSLQGLAKDFGVPLIVEPNSPQPKMRPESAKTKISIADSLKKQQQHQPSPQQQQQQQTSLLEEQQNKENENPLKDSAADEEGKLPSEESSSALYAQVSARLEPEGESRDTEDEADRALIINRKILTSPSANALQVLDYPESARLYNYANVGIPHADEGKEEYVYTIPKPLSTSDIDRLNDNVPNPEDLYAAINKSGLPKKSEFKVPEYVEQWSDSEVQKILNSVKTTSISNYSVTRLNKNNEIPAKPRRADVKTGNRAPYSSIVPRNPSLTDDLELLSLKSDSASIRTTSPKPTTGSPTPEAYVLNADIRLDDETFRIPDETMSNSLMARLDELSFAEERILRTIKLERGHGGSIGLQVMEGNDGGVYVQAVSVGGSADMAGNVNKGDRIVAINGQSLLNFRYEDALKMLQSSSETVELVLSQVVPLLGDDDDNIQEPLENNYLQAIRFNVSSETETSAMMSSKWLQKTIDVASVQNTSSAYSSAASSAMGNHNINSLYVMDTDEHNAINSASMLLSLEDFDISRTNESPQPPPVPPRRRKRSSTANERPTKLERKHRAAPPLPPPAAPQRSRLARKTPSPYPNENCSSAVSSTFDSLECGEAAKNSLSEPEENNARASEESPKSSRKSRKAPKKPERSRSPSPFEKPPEPNKYPPLYFTFQDFQTVMEGSLKHERQKSEEPCELDAIPFTDNVEFDNDREEIYFRVTTTDRPFKNILTDWSKSYDGDVEDFEREPQGDHIFDDYIDRSNKANKHLLINKQYFSTTQDEISITTERSTKVRFIVQSPSTSTPDTDLDYTSYKDFVDKQLQQHASVQLTELNDEESFAEASEVSENKSASEVDISDKLETGEDENATESINTVDASAPSDSPCDYKEDAKVMSVAERIDEVLHCDKGEERDVEENVSQENEEVDVYRDDTIDSEEFQEVNQRRKLFIDSSLYNLSNEDDDWGAYLDREKMKPQSSEKKSSEETEHQEQQEISMGNSEASVNVVLQEVPKIEISSFDEKSVPGNVRRNSFLEHMLGSDPGASPEISSNPEGPNCEVIAAHPKQPEEHPEENARSSVEEVARTSGGGSPPVIKSANAGQRPRINAASHAGGKSAGEVKSDVLNELLTNFGAIKLRPVNGAAAAELTKAGESPAKTDETHEIRSSAGTKVQAAGTSPHDKDTSAIVKEAAQLAERRRFDTDNKVKMPLAVNKDQIREAIAIIPGSVKNYIKYYEIHSEINSIAKLKDSMYKSAKNARKATKKSSKAPRSDDSVSTSPASSSPRPKQQQQQQSCMKSLSPKPERKKSVQFDSEFMVINPPKRQAKDRAKEEEDEGTFSSFIGGIRTRLKRKAPVKPDVKKSEQPKELNPREERRSDAATVICIQKSPELKARTTIPGNRSFLPQTETLQNSPTIVFYCTV